MLAQAADETGPGRAEGGQLSTRAYERLRQMILECDLAPGAPVSLPQLEAHLGLGKAAVRTALARLQQEGLVRPVARRGYLVAPLTLEDIENLMGLRLLLEPPATRMAAGRLPPEDLARLAELAEAGYEPGERESERRYLRANRDFHMIVVRAAGNDRLAQVMEQVLGEATRMLYLTMSSPRSLSATWAEGHRAIHAALAAGDGETAARMAEAEVIGGRQEILAAVLATPAIARRNLF